MHPNEYPKFDGNKMSGIVSTLDGEKLSLRLYMDSEHEKEQLQHNLKPSIVC